MLAIIQLLSKTLRRQWRTMGSSSYLAVFIMLGVAYFLLSLQLLIEFILSRINRGITKYDDMRSIQSWDKAPARPHAEAGQPAERPVRDWVTRPIRNVSRYERGTVQKLEGLRQGLGARRARHA